MERIVVNGITFTNLVDSAAKERALRSTYAPNEGKVYDLPAALAAGGAFFDRNLEAIHSAFRLLHGK